MLEPSAPIGLLRAKLVAIKAAKFAPSPVNVSNGRMSPSSSITSGLFQS